MFERRAKARGSLLENESEVIEAITRLLARREYSQQELRRRLASRVSDARLLENALERLLELGYQSDQRCALMLARQRLGQGYGERRIRHDLHERGIDQALIEQTLGELEVDWFERARAQAVRRFGESPPVDERERARRMRHLLGRGFGYDEVKYALETPPGE